VSISHPTTPYGHGWPTAYGYCSGTPVWISCTNQKTEESFVSGERSQKPQRGGGGNIP
jgi:hypothetical protein